MTLDEAKTQAAQEHGIPYGEVTYDELWVTDSKKYPGKIMLLPENPIDEQNATILSFDVSMVKMPFGKYKGTRISIIHDLDYLEWLRDAMKSERRSSEPKQYLLDTWLFRAVQEQLKVIT